MGNIKKILFISFGISIMSQTSQASMLDQVIYNVVGQVSNATGARLGDEIYYGSSRSSKSTARKQKHRKKKRTSAKRNYVPKITDEMRIQKSLSSLGFYRGRIDGQVNSFETRSAIKKMNIAYGISNSASLKPEAKDTLIFLGTLFDFDRHLISTNNAKRAKNRKIQVGLKLHGYYQGNIDGAIGQKTRGSIAEYKRDNGMNYSGTLDFEEEYQLISTAKEKNDKNIEDSIASLESMGRTMQHNATPAPMQVNTGYVYQRVQTQQRQRKVVPQAPVPHQAQTIPQQQMQVAQAQAIPQQQMQVAQAQTIPQQQIQVAEAQAIPQQQMPVAKVQQEVSMPTTTQPSSLTPVPNIQTPQ